MRHLLRLLTMLLAAQASLASAAEYCVVVSAASPVRSLSRREAVGVFTGRASAIEAGELLMVVDLPRGNPVRDRFFEALTGQPIALVNSHWARLQFSGRVPTPYTVADPLALRTTVRAAPLSIGYVEAPCNDSGLRTVLHVKGSS